MSNFITTKNLIIILRITLGIVFVSASIDKIINPLEFSNLIDNYHVTPIQLNNIAALIIPWIELVIGLCLITGFFIKGSSLISIILLIWFIIILSQALIRGIDLHCGCFDLSQKSNNTNLRLDMIYRIIKDFILLFFAIIIIKNEKSKD